jgi:hypothetical protein
MTQLDGHRVAVTVFLTAQGVDAQDARNVAEQAVLDALPQGTMLHLSYGPGAACVEAVWELGRAVANGYLDVQPTKRAYPDEVRGRA